ITNYNNEIEHDKLKRRLKADVYRSYEVIGCTISNATKNVKLLNYLKPRIVIIEGAVEIIEAHLIAALPSSVQHLIMIGDRLQQQSFHSEKLGYDYGIEESLFERLVNHGFPLNKLVMQYRMRESISSLLV